MVSTVSTGPKFSDLKLASKLLAILAHLKFTVPTPIQAKAIPVAVAGTDVIGIAQTGTGKTLAFSLPLLQRLGATKGKGLIILPTRELAMQVEETLHTIGRSLGLRTALLIGGASMHTQIRSVRHNPHVIIGTPGRIIDHLQQNTLKLHDVRVLVLDEADRMLDMGFAPQIQQILKSVPKERQTMLFSATMPAAIVQIARQYMNNPVRVEVSPAGQLADRITQELFIVEKEHKNRLLDKILQQYTGTVLVFSRTKFGAKRICRAVAGMDHAAAEIHSNLSLSQRKRSLEGFKSGKFRVLVATDIAARGIDVTNIELVINYDLPDNPDDYVHRVGRTGRAGKAGLAISFITPDQRSKIRHLERLVRTPLKVSNATDLPPARAASRQTAAETKFSDGHRRLTFAPGRERGRKNDRWPKKRFQPSRTHKKARIHA